MLDVHVVGIGLTEQQLATTLCVTNPNTTELAFRRVTITLAVSGAKLAEGASDLPVLLPPLSSTPVPFTAVTTVQNLGTQLLGVVRNGSLDYPVHAPSLARRSGLDPAVLEIRTPRPAGKRPGIGQRRIRPDAGQVLACDTDGIAANMSDAAKPGVN